MGGSLCQFSGVIYNLALLSNLRIIERHAHSIDAYGEDRYVPLGRDCTLVFGYKDLRFKNTLTGPILLNLSVLDDCVIGRISTNTPSEFKKVDIEVEELKTIKSSIIYRERDSFNYSGEIISHGFEGAIVQTTRIVKFKNGLIKKEFISRDEYKMMPKIILK